ncbi:MAG TPA: hypothetical protein VHH88_10640, partial [Verrucomicrobiae bacterium]|nr:hypothetical protein [Verrucomicrobiae bacterium]
EYEKPLAHFAAHYARPVNERLRFLPNPAEFALVYLGSFRAQFLHVQNDYRKRRRAFDTLFKHCHYDKNGSFAYRWENVLRRLETSDVDLIVSEIRKHIQVPGFNDPVTAAEKPPSASLPVPA